MLCFFFLFSQEPPVTSKEKQKSITTGSAPSNQAVWHSPSLSFNKLMLDQKSGEVQGDTHIPLFYTASKI